MHIKIVYKCDPLQSIKFPQKVKSAYLSNDHSFSAIEDTELAYPHHIPPPVELRFNSTVVQCLKQNV